MNLAHFFSVFPAELATLLMATLPFSELQGAIPIAITAYQLSPLKAYLLSVVGSVIPAFFILWLLGPVSGFLAERFAWAHRFFGWLFARTRHKFSGKYEVWGRLALVLFVAIPLPGAGVWSGSVAAFLFGIPKATALVLILFGSATAGLIVTLVTLGVIKIF